MKGAGESEIMEHVAGWQDVELNSQSSGQFGRISLIYPFKRPLRLPWGGDM